MQEGSSEKPAVKATATATVVNRGIHARPACMLIREALQYESDIYLSVGMGVMEVDGQLVAIPNDDSYRVNAKGIMSVLTLAATQGTVLFIDAEGSDAREACDAIRALIESGLGEL